MINRWSFLKFIGGGFLASTALSGYAFAIEPMYRLRIKHYRPQLPNWPSDLKLRIACLADIHACTPWMDAERIRSIVQRTNDLKPDLILLLGDYSSSMRMVTSHMHSDEWASILGELDAPLGQYAILGNHDWWDDENAQRTGKGPTIGQLALEKVGIPVLENDALKLSKDGKDFWLAGLGDQLAFRPSSIYKKWQGTDDLAGLMSKIQDDDPVILMAHEPDIFVDVPDLVSLTLSGHTHGGQINLFGYTPIVPSKYGSRFAYGHIVEDNKNLIVSGGLGCSIFPVRLGSPPEIVVVELGSTNSEV